MGSSSIKIKLLIGDLTLLAIFLILGISGVLEICMEMLNSAAVVISAVVLILIYKYVLLYLILFKDFLSISESLLNMTLKEGNLVERIPVNSDDEIGSFSRIHNIFIANIHNIIFKLRNIAKESKEMGTNLASSSIGISSSLDEIASTLATMETREQELENHISHTNKDVTEIRESIRNIVESIKDQVAAITDSSAAVEETISSITSLNNISESKKELITSLTKLANIGMGDMSKTLESIKRISETAVMIRQPIDVINSIASQTNLLAMNAAIEAAHAGQYGTGFSVVASEIRVLAETTAKNSKDITNNLNSIIEGIGESTDLTERTDNSIKKLTDGIQEVADSMNEIIIGLKEMSIGTNQIISSLGALHGITNIVQEDSDVIDEKSWEIDDSMGKVKKLSEQSNTFLKEFVSYVKEIKAETNLVAQSGTKNLEYIGIMEDILNSFKIIDTSELSASDGHLLIQWNKVEKHIPPRPDNPSVYPEDDEKHWYDMEFAGWGVKKENIPHSPADGSNGKYIICFQPHDHPYQIAYERGIRKVAEVFGIKIKFYYSRSDSELQQKQVNAAIRERPDLIVLAPVAVEGSAELFRRINSKGIPVIASNLVPEGEAFKSVIALTGPDDWMQSRVMAKKFAELMNYEGEYCLITHIPGSSCYYGRAYGVITELRKIAPEMKFLEMKYTEFNEDMTEKAVTDWIRKYGKSLTGIVSADESTSMIGIIKAIKKLNREDIIRVGICNSKIGLDFIKSGELHATTYQSAEGDGALSIEVAVDWFNGLDVKPVRNLPTEIITKENVDEYYPAQW